MRLLLVLACMAALSPARAAAPEETTISDAAIATATQLRERALEGSGAFAIVESVTTEVGHRMAGSANDARGVAWARAKFEALGFDKVYTEAVRFPTWRRGAERAEILAPFPQPLTLAALGGSVGTKRPLEAEVIEFATLQALLDAPADAAKGRIAYISNRMERHRDGRGYGPAVAARGRGASAAAAKGAVALLIRSIGTDDNRTPHTGMMRYEEGIAKIPAAALANPDADLLSAMLRRGEPVRVRLALDVGPGKDFESANVIGEITGRERPDEVVLIGGHLDSWDLGTGAIDNASGVAITMAAGALIGTLPQAPRRTIRVVAFANEEQGVYGGKSYTERHRDEVARHQTSAESDFGAGRIYGFNLNAAPHARAAVKRIAGVLEPLGIDWLAAKGGPGADTSGMAALGVAWAWLGQDGSDYFDHHHTANDTLDKVDAEDLDQQVAAYAVLAYLAAEADGDFGSAPTTAP